MLPCSSYLSAQSTHLVNEYPGADDFFSYEPEYDPDLWDWILKFGQSPQCRSYAHAMSLGHFTFSNCGSSNTVIQTAGGLHLNYPFDLPYYPLQIPPNVVKDFSPDDRGTCCGNCSLHVPEVRLYYFPEKTSDCHPNQTSKANSSLSAQSEGRVHSLIANESIAVISGFTLYVKYSFPRSLIGVILAVVLLHRFIFNWWARPRSVTYVQLLARN